MRYQKRKCNEDVVNIYAISLFLKNEKELKKKVANIFNSLIKDEFEVQ